MRPIFTLASAGILLVSILAAAAAIDIGFNDARVLNGVTGRTGLEAICLPELEKELAGRGFSPADIEFVPRTAAALAFWRSRSYAADFTFQDGPEATRVDGIMACVLDRNEVRVVVRTRSQPVRAS